VIRTRKGKLLIACGVVVFLLVSGLLAAGCRSRTSSATTSSRCCRPRHAATPTRCWRSCTGAIATVAANVLGDARRLKRAGQVLILADQSQTAYSLTSTVGDTRIAWKATGNRFPVVQCVRVERSGNVLSGS